MSEVQKSFFLLSFACIVWGVSFLPTQWLLNSVGVYEYLFYRFFFASAVFFIIAFKNIKQHYKTVAFKGLLTGVFMSMGFILQTLALPHTQSSTVAFLTGLSVVMVPFLALIFNAQKLRLKALMLCILASFGMYLFSDANISNFGKGEELSILCALFFALLIIFVDKFLKNNDLNTFVFFQFLACSIISFFAAIFLDKLSLQPILITPIFIYILIAALVLTVFCFFAQNYAQRYLSAEKVAILLLLEPISAGVLGYFYGEVFSILQIIGAAFILIAVALS